MVTLTNTGTGALPITSIVASGDFKIQSTTCSTSLAKGANCTVSVTFNPSVIAAITGALTFTDGATPSQQIVKLTGTGVAALAFSPTSLTLPSVAAGSTSSASLTVTNKSTNTAISLNPSVGSYYSITGGTCVSPLAANTSCTYTVSFSPLYKGSIKGALDIATNVAFSPSVVGLTGTATGGATVPLTISPASETFTSTGIGATAPAKVITVTNKGAATVTLSAITADADYSAVGSGTTPCTSGLALVKLAKCTFSVTFTPTGTGSIKGAVSISSTGGAVSPQIVGLTGTGALPVVVSPTSLTFIAGCRYYQRGADRDVDQQLRDDAEYIQHRDQRRVRRCGIGWFTLRTHGRSGSNLHLQRDLYAEREGSGHGSRHNYRERSSRPCSHEIDGHRNEQLIN